MSSFSVLVINSTCVSLSWTLLDNSSVPLSMVVQWSHHKGQSGDMWARLPYTDRPIYLRGNVISVCYLFFSFLNLTVIVTIISVINDTVGCKVNCTGQNSNVDTNIELIIRWEPNQNKKSSCNHCTYDLISPFLNEFLIRLMG